MDTQPTHALELDDGEQEPGRILDAARARLERLRLRLLRLDLGCRNFGGQRGTAETRHCLFDPFTLTPDLHLGVLVSPGTRRPLPYSPRPLHPVEYVKRRHCSALRSI